MHNRDDLFIKAVLAIAMSRAGKVEDRGRAIDLPAALRPLEAGNEGRQFLGERVARGRVARRRVARRCDSGADLSRQSKPHGAAIGAPADVGVQLPAVAGGDRRQRQRQ